MRIHCFRRYRRRSFTIEGITNIDEIDELTGKKLPEGDYLKELAHWLRMLPKPCGIFADNDVTALKVVEVCYALNIAILEEIKLVGCDNNLDICEKSPIPISSVCPDYENAAKLCAKLLEERMVDPSMTPRTVKYPISLEASPSAACAQVRLIMYQFFSLGS